MSRCRSAAVRAGVPAQPVPAFPAPRLPWIGLPAWGGMLLGLVSALGCGSSLPQGVPIRGTVTYQGQPLTSGTVHYFPAKPEEGREVMAEIGPDGTFELHTSRGIGGVLPGEYRIAIVAYKNVVRPDRTNPSREHPKDQGAPEPLIPEKYFSPETSGLTDVVNREHSGTKEITLE